MTGERGTDDGRRHDRRVWIAGILVAVALAVVIWGALGGIVAFAVSAAMLAFLLYLSLSSGEDREREEWARQEFERTGRWPDDPEG